MAVLRSVVIGDLYIERAAFLEPEAHTPLVVDADTVLTLAVTLQGFQPIAGRDAQEGEIYRGVELLELAHGDRLNVDESSDPLTFEQGFGFVAGEGQDHELNNNASR
jgi:hypothetical protein